MKKIISLFARNYDGDRLVRNEVVDGAQWVLAGEGTATRKFDGSACLVRDGRLYKRYDLPLKREWANKKKRGYVGPWVDTMYETPPDGWKKAEPWPDQHSGHWPGWLPIGGGPEDSWHREAWTNQTAYIHHLNGTTWELCGPKVQGNPEQAYVESEVGPNMHILIPHGRFILADCPRDFDGIREYLRTHDIEGIVWWRDLNDPDCEKVKVKAKDFGLKRGKAGAP